MHKKLQDLPTSSVNSRLTLGGMALSELAPEPVAYPLVTFIIRNWNYGRFVGAAIRSVRNQDYPNLEAIVVDNGSTDNSRSEIEAAIGDDPRFRTIWLDRNLGGLAAGLAGLHAARGDFVCFVDSDDYVFTDFASTHVQAHLALAGRAAFTSNSVIEVDGDGGIVSLDARLGPSSSDPSFCPEWAVPRLSEVSDQKFNHLLQGLAVFDPWQGGWPWSPGTANMFRRAALDLSRPRIADDQMFGLAADGHFCMLGHALGGSATINIPLSAYRQHGANSFAGSSAIKAMWQATGPATQHFAKRRREALRVLVEQAELFVPRIGTARFWSSLAHVLGTNGSSPKQDFDLPETRSVISENLDHLFAAFGKWRTLRKLRVMMSRNALHSTLRDSRHRDFATLYGPGMAGVEIAAFAEQLKRKLRSLRRRPRSAPSAWN
ncbi:glycosyltransferase family A protein [Hoeflea sp. 108]|jgi:hypothetical protein|uniref:glycosyltransferase family 2 protein n=1 Tax=Hoeflea sp. 108 TaxID=1116369 RepID=UPI0003A14BBC|nr:glycosyltransferase family A protein [Hoeflea sp. 108]